MSDLIVRLYDFHPESREQELLKEHGIRFVRPLTPDRTAVAEFVREQFGEKWASECETAFFHFPVSCFVAVDRDNRILGFACYEATAKGFFGPTGVRKDCRGQGIGAELLKKSLLGMRELGYAYAIIGGASSYEFYHKVCGAEMIAGSETGIYSNLF